VFSRKRKPKNIDFLSLPDHEKIKRLREIKLKLRTNLAEEKLWRSFVEAETLTINGKLVTIDELNEGLTLPQKRHNKRRKAHHLDLRTNVL
jgi:hypothetical protein